jgi:phosphatidylethanolamine-binding protein
MYRYIVVVYSQPQGFDASATPLVNASTPRTNFNLSMFAQSVGLGNPIAGNFFLTGPSSNGSGSGDASQTGSAGSPAPTNGASSVAAGCGTVGLLIFTILVTGFY